MKSIRKTLAIVLALVLLCGMMPVGLTAHASTYVNFSIEGTSDYASAKEVLEELNTARENEGLPPLALDSTLWHGAMTRAVEYYVFSSPTRPDGSDLGALLAAPFHADTTIERSIICDDNDVPTKNWIADPELYNPKYSTVGIGCFRQDNGKTAWVLLLSISDGPDYFWGMDGTAYGLKHLRALPSNLGGQILHHSFSNALCACYLYEGTTVGTELQLLNVNNTSVKITPSEIDYSYTTSHEGVFSIDNEAHTITAKSPGKATLSILVDGQHIRIASNSADVEVMKVPELSYTQSANGDLHIHYGDFSTQLNMYYKGTMDDMWTMANIEADGIYELTLVDPTETYTFEIRYWDKWLDDWVVVGEPLIIQLGDKEPEPEVTPEPTPTPDFGSLQMPTEAELPNRTSEPTIAEAEAILADISENRFLPGDPIENTLEYEWFGGVFNHNLEGHTGGEGELALALAISDLIFGKLPAQQHWDITANDLRPGDIILTRDNRCLVVTKATPIFVETIGVSEMGWESCITSSIEPSHETTENISSVLSRYTSTPAGADVLHPSIVPEDAWINASKSFSTPINHTYICVMKWTMTADGTLYLEGYGRPGYGDDSWIVYKDRIKKVVFGPGITGVLQEAFEGYEALEEVVLSDTVDEIRRDTFGNCSNLKSITFGKGLKLIEENAFQCSGLESLVLPDTVESIGSYAFSNCKNLKTVFVPNSVTQWGNNVFTSCDALEDLTLEDGLTTLGFSAFNHLDSLKTVNIPGSIKTIRQMAFYFSDIETLNIAEGVETIEEEAFAYCKQLKEIHLPNTITTIEDSAFRDCDNVTDVYFYGTEAQWNSIEIGLSNDCLEGSWWSPTTIHFVDQNQCFHKNITVLPAVAPTCTETGLTEGKICADCRELLTPQNAVPSLDHNYVEVKRTEPTCSEAGEAEYICTNDPKHRYTEAIAPTNVHSYKNGYCTMCGVEKPEGIENLFTDVSEGDWYHNSVMWAKSNEVTGGKTATTFAPNEGCTRAQVVTFLWAANGKPEPKIFLNPFDDVADDAWYLKPVLWAVENGITGGISKYEFGPDQTCTRAQIVTFLYAAANKPPVYGGSSFLDVANSDWYAAPVIWAAENDVTGGIGNGMFGPNDTCTRAQVVTFLYKVYG